MLSSGVCAFKQFKKKFKLGVGQNQKLPHGTHKPTTPTLGFREDAEEIMIRVYLFLSEHCTQICTVAKVALMACVCLLPRLVQVQSQTNEDGGRADVG
jgi:hypothetical protein